MKKITVAEKNKLWLSFTIHYNGHSYNKATAIRRKALTVEFMETYIDELANMAKECLGASLGFKKYKEYHKLEEMVQK